MAQYIPKDALVAEIERLHKKWEMGNYVHEKLILFLNTLEVKDVDLENNMVCKVGWNDGFFLDYTQEQQDFVLEKIGVKVGDKVKILVIKEE